MSTMKRALITGITGQDGAYLAQFLLKKGYEVFGTYRRVSTPNFWRLQALDIYNKVQFVPADLLDTGSLYEAIKLSQPNEIYHLAAQSFVGASFEQPISSGNVNGLGVVRILEAVRHMDPSIRVYQASTSELYGNVPSPQSETTPFNPVSPYAAGKLYGYWSAKMYREGYNLFACNGILFNHESPLRGLEFVTRKITNTVAKIELGLEKELALGNLESKRDWGYAPDYVESMWMMLQQNKADDYVIATGETHSVQEFVERAFEVIGKDWKDYVKVDKRFTRPLDVHELRGNTEKSQKTLGWKPSVTFDKLVKIMVEADLERWQAWKAGKSFPWDAMHYPNESQILSRSLKLEKL